MQVYVVEELVLFSHQRDQAVSGQKDGEDQVFGFSCLQAWGDHISDRSRERQAGDGAEQQTGVPLEPVQKAVGEVLGTGQQAAQVVVLFVLKDVIELGEGEQTHDLEVDVLQLPQQLLLWLGGLWNAH